MWDCHKKKEELCKKAVINQISLEHLANLLYENLF